MEIKIEGLTRSFGSVVAVDDLSLRIAEGELLVLLGPSGCGKTTTLRCIAGLETPDRGRIAIGGHVVFDAAQDSSSRPNKRNVGMVFQSYAIWPHMTVFENVAFPLEREGRCRKPRSRAGRSVLASSSGSSGLATRGASQLSRRPAAARRAGARLVMRADACCCSTSRSATSTPSCASTCGSSCANPARARHHHGLRHPRPVEALAWPTASRYARRPDRPARYAEQIYAAPSNVLIADFLGVSNIVPGRVVAKRDGGLTEVVLAANGASVMSRSPVPVGREVHVCMRPEHLAVAPSAGAAAPTDQPELRSTMALSVQVASFLGSHVRYLLTDGQSLQLEAMSTDTDRIFDVGARVEVSISAAHAQLLEN